MYKPDKLSESLFVEAPRETEPWRKALLDAAGYIRVHGFWQCEGRSEGVDSVCALLSIARITKDQAFELDIGYRFATYIGTSYAGIIEWNDHPSRTKEDVIRALTECARS